jgi:hypothetical protein
MSAMPHRPNQANPARSHSVSESARLLELIEEGIATHGGDLGGWTARSGAEARLFDGRISVRVEIIEGDPSKPAVHAHVLATLHDYDDVVLDACVVGIGADREEALLEAARVWIPGVAAPIRSFLDDRPVCMASPAGLDAQESMGLAGVRAFAGPFFPRGFDDEEIIDALGDALPWFRFAAESAAPRRVHLAKVSISSNGAEGWTRQLEIDGHEVALQDPRWPAGVTGPDFGYVTRFVVFELSESEVQRQTEVDRAILHFAAAYGSAASVDVLMDAMVEQGFDADLVQQVESIATIAFGRYFFEQRGVRYSPTVIRARRDGRVERDVHQLSIPVFSRAVALAPSLEERLGKEAFVSLCMYSAESNAILQAYEANPDLDLAELTMYPCVIPERDVPEQTMQAALGVLQEVMDLVRADRASPEPEAPKKAWWKIW